MRETWLRPNRRAILFGCVPLLIGLGLGGWLAFGLPGEGGHLWRWIGMAVMVGCGGLVLLLMLHVRRPRIACRDGRLLFYLRSGGPIEVPVHVVEAFFFGQGPAMLPGAVVARQQTVNLVARLSQRETDWANREVKPALGQWRDGYVTIRGAWCEPLSVELLRRLNRRLKEVQSVVDDP